MLETGHSELAPWFSEISLHRYEDALVVTEVEPLVAYVASKVSLSAERQAELARFAGRELRRQGGALRITKDYGLFKAVRR